MYKMLIQVYKSVKEIIYRNQAIMDVKRLYGTL